MFFFIYQQNWHLSFATFKDETKKHLRPENVITHVLESMLFPGFQWIPIFLSKFRPGVNWKYQKSTSV